MKTRITPLLVLSLAALGLADACDGKVRTAGGSETNWFGVCAIDADCPAGHCWCGVCTEPCSQDAACPGGEGPDRCALATTSVYDLLCAGATVKPPGVCAKSDADGGSIVEPRPSGPTTYTSYTLSADPTKESTLCVPNVLPSPKGGRTACTVVELSPAGGSCDCSAPGRTVPSTEVVAEAQIIAQRWDALGGVSCSGPSCTAPCACEVTEATGPDLDACRNDPAWAGTSWCYVDPDHGVGSAAIVDKCPAWEHRAVHLGAGRSGIFTIECDDATVAPGRLPAGAGNIGDPCTPTAELSASFSGFEVTQMSVDRASSDCSSGTCLVATFEGRTDCPSGQPTDPSDQTKVDPKRQHCSTSGPDPVPVTVPVMSQITIRPASDAVYCSCRCDGPPGAGPFCDCPTGFDCAPLLGTSGAPQPDALAGSYCVKSGTLVTAPFGGTSTPSM